MADGPRVLLVLGTSTGGVGQHVRSLATGLPGRVTVAGPALTQQVFGFPDWVALEVGASPHPVRDARAIRRLRGLARQVDIVHAHGLRAGALAALAGVHPLVVTWHNAVSGRVGGALQRLVARRADVTLAASADLLATALGLGGRDVRPGPVAAPVLTPTGGDPGLGHPLVLAVGRLHPQKGYDVLLAAQPLMGEVVVAVAGDGPLRAALQTAGPAVRWLGHRDDVADLLAAADVVVLPSIWEARSLTAQQVLLAGRPLIASSVGGLPALLGDGAVLVPPGDPAALARAVRRLLDDPVEAAALVARGRLVAARWPDEAATVRQVAAVYAELLG